MSDADGDEPAASESPLIQSILQASVSSKKKIPHVLKPYQLAARWIPLSINPFVGLTRVIYAGLEPDDPQAEYTEQELELYERVVRLVPQFRDTITQFHQKPEHLDIFVNMLNKWASEAQHEDTGSVKYSGLEYIPRDFTVDSLNPPITRNQGKSVRGFNHQATARLLCPYRDVATFDANPDDYMERVQDGKIKIKSTHWPTFLYDENQPYDPAEKDKGLFRGHLLLRIYRHIFTGPSSALQRVRVGTKRSKAELHNMTEVTGRTIAYACIQARNMLSSTEQWAVMDGRFNMEKFFDAVVELFERDPGDDWVIKTLEFWNREVPSLRSRKKKPVEESDEDEDEDEDVEDIFAQRRARLAQPIKQHKQNQAESEPDDHNQDNEQDPDRNQDNEQDRDRNQDHEQDHELRDSDQNRGRREDKRPNASARKPPPLPSNADRNGSRIPTPPSSSGNRNSDQVIPRKRTHGNGHEGGNGDDDRGRRRNNGRDDRDDQNRRKGQPRRQ